MNILNKVVGDIQARGKKGRHHVRNVFAKPLDLIKVHAYTPPVFAKSPEEESFLATALPKNFCFETLSAHELHQLVQAMEPCSVKARLDIITQGEEGDYFYVIYQGAAEFIVDGKVVGKAGKGDSFGELSLLYKTPRAATVRAIVDTALYRVDQTVFRYVLQAETVTSANEKTELLKKVEFLKDLDAFNLNKLAQVMAMETVEPGTVLMKKGDVHADKFYVLASGSVLCTDIGVGEVTYEDFVLNKPGDYFGERAILTGEPRAATVTCQTVSVLYTIDRKTFETVLGKYKRVIEKAGEKRKLGEIKLLADCNLNDQELTALGRLVKTRKFPAGTYLLAQGESTRAALYLIRSGTVRIGSKILGPDEYFGDEQLKADVGASAGYHLESPSEVLPEYSAIAETNVVCGVLRLADCRKVFDTRFIGQSKASAEKLYDSLVERGLQLDDLQKHTVLGAGTFGQVWLVSRKTSTGERKAYALKIQSKYELCQDGQAKAVVYEKNIMSQLHHPFLIRLVNSYQDDNCVYILLDLIQGGELYTYIHTKNSNSLSENDARFYSACIAEGLGFMHRRGYVYRDLKPENVLVDKDGYCIIIDFGFVKFVPDKTFTLCGTPLYLPPEVITNRGHNQGADHWSLGILIFEMLTGDTPFYKNGMDQMELFKSIVKGKFEIPRGISPEASSIIADFIVKNPSQRLGSLAGGEDDIPVHPWFSSIDFDDLLLKKVKAPKVPVIADPLDSSNFEDWGHVDDKSKMKYPKLNKTQNDIFKDF